MRWVFVLGIMFLSQACTNQQQLAEQAVMSRLLDGSGASFREMEALPGNVVCGEYTTSRRKSNKTYQPFIYNSGEIYMKPSKEEKSIFCGANAEQALYDIYGISFNGEAGVKLLQIRDDFVQLGMALENYRTENSWLPSSEQGLIALSKPSEIHPEPRAFRKGGYINEIPFDPWNRAYLYTGSTYAGTQRPYKLLTLGADGKTGGSDENADVKSDYIKYINYVDKIH